MPVMSDSLGLCVVALVKLGRASVVLTKVSCKLCSWAPEAFTTLHRVKEHFGDLPLTIKLTSTVCRLPGGGQAPRVWRGRRATRPPVARHRLTL